LANGTTKDDAEYLERRAIVPNQSVLVITQIAPPDAYSSQIEPMRTPRDSLVIP
jgi:hypothetical protein